MHRRGTWIRAPSFLVNRPGGPGESFRINNAPISEIWRQRTLSYKVLDSRNTLMYISAQGNFPLRTHKHSENAVNEKNERHSQKSLLFPTGVVCRRPLISLD